jgi:hypothetical protein
MMEATLQLILEECEELRKHISDAYAAVKTEKLSSKMKLKMTSMPSRTTLKTILRRV